MTHSLPADFYLIVHDFDGRAYGGLLSTNEGPLAHTRAEAHDHLSEVLSTWSRTTWQVLHAVKRDGGYVLSDVTAEFADEREAMARARDRAINGPFEDPNHEHRLTAAQLGVGRFA